MVQKVVPITEVILPPGKNLGWEVILKSGRIVGFESTKYGRFEHVAFVDSDTGNFLYDGIRKLDGPPQDDGHATPSGVLVVVEEKADGFYFHCVEESRAIIFDHINGVQGVNILGFGGGFARKGEKPNETALRELIEETGIEVEKTSVELIGYASDNRATTETCHEVYLAVFKRKGKSNPDLGESIKGTKLIRVDQFPAGQDAIVNSAAFMAVKHLGLIIPEKKLSSKFKKDFIDRVNGLLDWLNETDETKVKKKK